MANKIYNPVTGSYYEVVKKKNRQKIRGLWRDEIKKSSD